MESVQGEELYHGTITPSMREGKLNLSSFNRVNELLFKFYWERASYLNPNATFHLTLTMDDPDAEKLKA